MQIGAVIVAAGMSTRMGEFKPMLNIGSISVAQRILANFHQAGIKKIVMVTGYNATALERHLAGNGVLFLRNEDYETTQMFDSAKIGLNYLKNKCDKVLFTPVDVPLFTASTIQTLIDSNAELACPVCEEKIGHPILISTSLIDHILNDNGERGLKGALDRCPVEMTMIHVDDLGTIKDADTPEEYSALLEYHNSQLIRPKVQAELVKEKTFFDDKIAMLLTLIEETASVKCACQRMQISYSTGWNIIRNLEAQLCYPLVIRNQGGAGGSTSSLTEEGKQLLDCFNNFQSDLREQANLLYKKHFTGVFK